MIFAGLLALNHSVLPFDGWPLNDDRQNTGSQMLPRAPAETGRLRTATGGTPGGSSAGGAAVIAGGAAPATSPVTIGSAGAVLRLAAPPERARSRSTAPSAPLLSRAGVDSDHDGVDNSTEQRIGSDPLAADSDGDGIPDGWEVDHGLNPTTPVDAGAEGGRVPRR